MGTRSNMIKTFLAVGFFIAYVSIQVLTILHDGQGDDLISARLQDIMVMIITSYFTTNKRNH